ncbi:fumarylacetoacetate hydrolase family protein [Paraburkholderia sp. D15]|uniref:fumarylacetoacetate hydrolase family protein n=1 Tax=Paraburkholderia sp. D15 TaxID=2880218 RepID=UPI002479A4B3|nr:fumarylacetoacetate hydrolase family protein [Paraburkholderia sp. D15]WGS54691.1 fumarylacetoacetate hydrolase family protein [Paraburkholderia sp. D15]
MKLASLHDGSRDGALVVVSRDLLSAVAVPKIAPSLRVAVENWAQVEAELEDVYRKLSRGSLAEAVDFVSSPVRAPLPRSFQWLDGSAFLNHAELVRRARNADIPASMYKEPMIYQGASDSFAGPHDDIVVPDESWGIDLESEVAVITDDVPMSCSPQASAAHIKLLVIANDVSLRNLMPDELAKGFGFVTSKPSTAFSPVAVTPDELGSAWDGRKLSLKIESRVNGRVIGTPNAGVDMNFDFAEIISFATKSRVLSAGTIVGSGTVSNRDRSVGSACLQEIRMIEKIETGEVRTPHLRYGDLVEIAALDDAGWAPFGHIRQRVKAPQTA